MRNAIVKLVSKRGTERLGAFVDDFFALSARDIAGREFRFSELRGRHRAFLLVNVACECGLTGEHYEQLTALDARYSPTLAIMAFPCNQFGGQEPGDDAAIERVVRERFNARFLLFSKVEVNGADAHPVFRFLRARSSLGAGGEATKIPWNFAKFLVDGRGQLVEYFPPTTPPKDLETQIRRLLELPPIN